jgi:hypothetical protein
MRAVEEGEATGARGSSRRGFRGGDQPAGRGAPQDRNNAFSPLQA